MTEIKDIINIVDREQSFMGSTINFLVGSLIIKVIEEGGIGQCIKVGELQNKLESRRKRWNPRYYRMRYKKRDCAGDLDE